MPAIAMKLRPEERQIIDNSFDAFKNDKGVLTTESMKAAFKEIDTTATDTDIQLLIDDIDENGDGEVDKGEFTSIMARKFLGQDDDNALLHIWEMMDEDKDGYIPTVQLRYMLMREGRAPLSEQEADELMMFADPDGDGLVPYKWFLSWLANPEREAVKISEKEEGKERAQALEDGQQGGQQQQAIPNSPTR